MTTGAAIVLLGVVLAWLQPRWLLGDVMVELLWAEVRLCAASKAAWSRHGSQHQ
jgi:hypothetical protein